MSTTDSPIPWTELVKLLSPSLGQQKAEALVKQAAEELKLRLDPLSRVDALKVMERIADQPGLVGITARFAKSRVHLWTQRAT